MCGISMFVVCWWNGQIKTNGPKKTVRMIFWRFWRKWLVHAHMALNDRCRLLQHETLLTIHSKNFVRQAECFRVYSWINLYQFLVNPHLFVQVSYEYPLTSLCNPIKCKRFDSFLLFIFFLYSTLLYPLGPASGPAQTAVLARNWTQQTIGIQKATKTSQPWIGTKIDSYQFPSSSCNFPVSIISIYYNLVIEHCKNIRSLLSISCLFIN